MGCRRQQKGFIIRVELRDRQSNLEDAEKVGRLKLK